MLRGFGAPGSFAGSVKERWTFGGCSGVDGAVEVAMLNECAHGIHLAPRDIIRGGEMMLEHDLSSVPSVWWYTSS